MNAKMIPVILAATFVCSPAMAQSANPAKEGAPAAQTMKYKGEWRSTKLIGLDVYNQNNEKIGDVNEILLDPSGKVVGHVLGVGGFLGIGEHDVLLSPDKIKFVEEPRARTADADRPANADRNAAARNEAATSGTASKEREARRNDELWVPDHAMVNMTKEQVKAMPQFKYSNYN